MSPYRHASRAMMRASLAVRLAGIVGTREVAPNLNCVSGLGSPVAVSSRRERYVLIFMG